MIKRPAHGWPQHAVARIASNPGRMAERRDVRDGVRPFANTDASASDRDEIARWEAEFATCFAVSRANLVRAACSVLHHDLAAADDSVQAAAASIWIHHGRYALQKRPLLPLLMSAVRRAALNEAKRVRRSAHRVAPLEACESRAYSTAWSTEGDFALKEDLVHALPCLTPRERVVFWHIRVRECSTAETAAILSLSAKTIQNVVARVSCKLTAAFWRTRVSRGSPR